MKKIIILTAAVIGISLFPFFAEAQRIQDGISAYNSKNYNKSFRFLYALSRNGEPTAMYYIGRMLIDGGQAITPNIPRGHSFIKKAAKKNYRRAIYYLIDNYSRENSKLGKDIPRAIQYSDQLCRQKDDRACAKKAKLLFSQPNRIARENGCQDFKLLYDDRGEESAAYPVARCIIEKVIKGSKTEVQKLLRIAIKRDKKNEEAVSALLNFYNDNIEEIEFAVSAFEIATEALKRPGLKPKIQKLAKALTQQKLNDKHCKAATRQLRFPLLKTVCVSAIKNGGRSSYGVLADHYFNAKKGFPLDKKLAKKYSTGGMNKGDKKSQEIYVALASGDGGDAISLPLTSLVNLPSPQKCELLNNQKKAILNPKKLSEEQFNIINNECSGQLKGYVLAKFADIYERSYKDMGSTLRLRDMACEKGSSNACLRMGNDYEGGKIKPENTEVDKEVTALRYYKKGYEYGNTEAAYQCWLLAKQNMASHGDEVLAKKCIKMAVQNQNTKAIIELVGELGYFSNSDEKSFACSAIKKLLKTKSRILSPKDKETSSKLIEKNC